MASISTIVTLGYGSFGSVNLLPTLGYGIDVAAPPTPDTPSGGGARWAGIIVPDRVDRKKKPDEWKRVNVDALFRNKPYSGPLESPPERYTFYETYDALEMLAARQREEVDRLRREQALKVERLRRQIAEEDELLLAGLL